MPTLTRGFLCGMFCVLPLYQGFWDALAEAGLRFEPYPERGVPLLAWLALGGGILGAGLAWALRRRPGMAWQAGGLAGAVLALAVWFGLAPALGSAPAWNPVALAHVLTVFAGWGAAVGLALRCWPAGEER